MALFNPSIFGTQMPYNSKASADTCIIRLRVSFKLGINDPASCSTVVVHRVPTSLSDLAELCRGGRLCIPLMISIEL